MRITILLTLLILTVFLWEAWASNRNRNRRPDRVRRFRSHHGTRTRHARSRRRRTPVAVFNGSFRMRQEDGSWKVVHGEFELLPKKVRVPEAEPEQDLSILPKPDWLDPEKYSDHWHGKEGHPPKKAERIPGILASTEHDEIIEPKEVTEHDPNLEIVAANVEGTAKEAVYTFDRIEKNPIKWPFDMGKGPVSCTPGRQDFCPYRTREPRFAANSNWKSVCHCNPTTKLCTIERWDRYPKELTCIWCNDRKACEWIYASSDMRKH